jgi:hypothetical protein
MAGARLESEELELRGITLPLVAAQHLANRVNSREAPRVCWPLVRDAESARGPAQFQPLIGLLLLLGRYQRLARVAPLPDAGLGDELGSAAATLFRHGFFQRKNPGLFGQ